MNTTDNNPTDVLSRELPVAVIGLGTMGHGIAQAFAVGGYTVRAIDERPETAATALDRIAKAEEFLHGLGIRQLRVRHHDTIARIEIESNDVAALMADGNRQRVSEFFRSIGYSYVTLDLEGFRSGSLNEVLPKLRAKKKAR